MDWKQLACYRVNVHSHACQPTHTLVRPSKHSEHFFFLVNISTIMTFITSPEHFLKVDYLMAFLTPLVQLYQDAKFHKSANYSEQQLAISTVLKVVSFRLRFWLSVSLFPAAQKLESTGAQLHRTCGAAGAPPLTPACNTATSKQADEQLVRQTSGQLLVKWQL